MNNVWYAIVRFFQRLFVPPEYTTLEKELIRQVSYLEGELHREREERKELIERFIPSVHNVETKESNVVSIGNTKPSWEDRRAQLEEESRQRKAARVEEFIRQQEKVLYEGNQKEGNEGRVNEEDVLNSANAN